MALQYSAAVRDAQANALETTIGTGPILYIRTGAPPADCSQADSGTLLCQITLPSDWLSASSGGSKSMAGVWTGTGAAGASTGTAAGHFRVKDSGGTTCHMQGTITAAGGGGDMTLDNNSIAQNQNVNVASFTVARGNG